MNPITQRGVLQKKFRIFIWLSLFVLLMEVIGGIVTNSLALLSDAGHVFIDLVALLLAYFALRLSTKASTEKFTFGYYRAEILAAIANGILLIFLTLYIFYLSYHRFLSPQKINGAEMFIIAFIGLVANLYVVIKMHGTEQENLNIRGAYLHILSDTVSSVGVVVAGALILITGNYIFDPIVSAMIGIFILVSCLRLIRESTNILMEAVPKNINIQQVTADFAEEYGFLLTKQTIQMYLTSKNLSLFKELCKKIQMLEGNDKPLLLKNPYDFPNFLFIKKMFPDAKFVFIHRHPFKTISSARSAMDILTQRKNPYGTQLLFGLNEKVYHPLLLYPLRLIFSRIPEISVIIITRITASWTNYYMKNVKKLPANDYVTITYEEFCMHPQATIETIMNKFSIPARNTFDASKLMKPRGKEVDPSVRKFQPFIYKSLKKYFDLFGYSNQ